MITYVLFFLFGLAFDTLWVLCLHFVATRSRPWRRHLATIASVTLAGLGAISQANIAWDKWLIVPEITGMLIGMYVGMYVADKIESMEEDGGGRNDRRSNPMGFRKPD